MRIGARKRLEYFVDPGTQEEIAANLEPQDPLKFRDSKRYRDRISQAQKKTGEKDALVAVKGTLKGEPIVVCAFEFGFMGGSMGSVVGERFCRAAKLSAESGSPLICFSASGGARMQEGPLPLMQMAKTTAAAQRCSSSGVPYIAVFTDPTMAGVLASYASIADVILAEPKALVGFAGARVSKQAQVSKVPDDFQTAEFVFQHGMLDRIVPRKEMRSTLAALVKMLGVGCGR